MFEDLAVRTENLTRRFGRFIAVDRVSLEVARGEIFGFLGANGAGKTTTIRMLCGLLSPSEGEGWVAGYSIRTQPEEIKKIIGYMSQKFSLYPDLKVLENLKFFGGVYGLEGEELEKRLGEVLEKLELSEWSEEITAQLPLGFKQRLGLACAVLHHPQIVFLDEPTSGVDPLVRKKFWELIYQLAEQGTTVFVTTHYLEEAEYCHRLAIMHQGRIIAYGSPGELKHHWQEPSIHRVFIRLVKEGGR